MPDRVLAATVATLALLAGAGCGDGTSGPDAERATGGSAIGTPTTDVEQTASAEATETADDEFPDIVEATATYDDSSGSWTFAVTVSSPYDTPDRYADGWRVLGPDGTVFGVHTLTHDHANEQPFTRHQSGVVIPDDVTEVTIEGRDQANGFGGTTVTVALNRG